MTALRFIGRPVVRQSCGLLAAICLSGAMAVEAQAQSFDLDCIALDDGGNVSYSRRGTHIQVDLESGQWCEERCSEIGEGAHLLEDGVLMLKDGENYFGELAVLYYEPEGKRLVNVTDAGGDFERGSTYTCSEDAFGGLQPYLAENPHPHSLSRLWTLFRKENLPDGFSAPEVNGRVGIALAVSKDGQLEGCSIHSSSGSQELDDFTCAVIEKAGLTFDPATDRSGMVIDGVYRTNVIFAGWE